MDDILKKVSEYQIFNFLLSGAVFVTLLSSTTSINLAADNNIIASFFVYYFAGLVLSRIGSLIIAPLLKRIGFVKYAPYNKYLSALKRDPKLDTLSQENNTYRTLIATFLTFTLVYAGVNVTPDLSSRQQKITVLLCSLILLLLFTFAFRKQTSFIRKRVEHTGKIDGKN